jgi:hypothetical protein
MNKTEILRQTLLEKGWDGYFTESSQVWKAVEESMQKYADQQLILHGVVVQSEQMCQMCKCKKAEKEQLCNSCWGDVNA